MAEERREDCEKKGRVMCRESGESVKKNFLAGLEQKADRLLEESRGKGLTAEEKERLWDRIKNDSEEKKKRGGESM